jgi:hypothetical protein
VGAAAATAACRATPTPVAGTGNATIIMIVPSCTFFVFYNIKVRQQMISW